LNSRKNKSFNANSFLLLKKYPTSFLVDITNYLKIFLKDGTPARISGWGFIKDNMLAGKISLSSSFYFIQEIIINQEILN